MSDARILIETPSQMIVYNENKLGVVMKSTPTIRCPTCGRQQDKQQTSNNDENLLFESTEERLESIHQNQESSHQNQVAIVDPKYFSILEDWLSSKSFNQGYYDRFFIELQKLGRGQRGTVFLVRHVLDQIDLGEFAVKAVPTGASHSWLVKMLREVLLLGKLKHQNIVEYKHAWLENRKLSPFVPEVPCLFILMELANGGNLEEFIQVGYAADSSTHFSNAFQDLSQLRKSKRSNSEQLSKIAFPITLKKNIDQTAKDLGGIGLDETGRKVRYLNPQEIQSLFTDICLGLQHLHANNIIHRDLKPPNLLLFYPSNDKKQLPRVMISDFGECELISEEIARIRSGGTGTLEFMPPEVLLKDKNGNYLSNHSTSVDLWSLGILLYYLCFSSVPYTQTDDVDLLKNEILNFDAEKLIFPSTSRVPKAFLFLIRRLLAKDASKRPKVDVVLEELSLFNFQEQSPSDEANVAAPSSPVLSVVNYDPTTDTQSSSSPASSPDVKLEPSFLPESTNFVVPPLLGIVACLFPTLLTMFLGIPLLSVPYFSACLFSCLLVYASQQPSISLSFASVSVLVLAISLWFAL